MNAVKKHRLITSVFLGLSLMFGTSLLPVRAQDEVLMAGPTASESGWFSIIWGDSQDGKSSMVYTLTNVTGQQTLLRLEESVIKALGGVLQFNGKYVEVQGALATTASTAKASDSAQNPPAVLNVISISIAPSPQSAQSATPAMAGLTVFPAVSGSKPWVTIMCKFSDQVAEPNDVIYFQGMYADTKPGLNHYWKELSFGIANIDGSDVGPGDGSAGAGWYTLPHTMGYYNPTATEKSADLNALASDCIGAADSTVDFTPFTGINMMFNGDFDYGWAWGGGGTITLDGNTRYWSITWEPPWSYADISVISHEMGHGFGLPHSSYDRAAVYDNAWDVMSADRYNCAAATDPTYGCMAQHTISHHKDFLGWIAGKVTVAAGTSTTVALEDLALPTAPGGIQMVVIPIGGSATNFYTVEARRFTGYDVKLPDAAVVVHNVDTTNDIPAVLVPGGLPGGSVDPAVMFKPGETFVDAINHITVHVSSATDTASEVVIGNGNQAPTSDAGGPYTEECTSPVTTLALDGRGSSDPEGLPLTYAWTTNCPGAAFNNATLAQPTLTVNSVNSCVAVCNVSLTVTDDLGVASGSDTATVTIRDTTPPAVICPADDTIQCDASPDPSNTGTATATDTCCAAPTVSYADVTAPGSCPQASRIARTWTATDLCPNTASCVQQINIVDTKAPMLMGVPSDETVQCDAVPPPAVVTATDTCDLDPFITFSEVRTDGSCAANYTLSRSWSGVDHCGNSSTAAQTVTVQDTVGPIISCNSPATMTPPDAPMALTATATDNCSTASTQITSYNCVGKDGKSRMSSCVVALSGAIISILDSGGVNDNISWTVQSTDGCGNTTNKTCSISVVNPGKH